MTVCRIRFVKLPYLCIYIYALNVIQENKIKLILLRTKMFYKSQVVKYGLISKPKHINVR